MPRFAAWQPATGGSGGFRHDRMSTRSDNCACPAAVLSHKVIEENSLLSLRQRADPGSAEMEI
jgi:hypothetical protein